MILGIILFWLLVILYAFHSLKQQQLGIEQEKKRLGKEHIPPGNYTPYSYYCSVCNTEIDENEQTDEFGRCTNCQNNYDEWISDIPEKVTESESFFREVITNYCDQFNIGEIPLSSEVLALCLLKEKFYYSSKETNIIEEFMQLKDVSLMSLNYYHINNHFSYEFKSIQNDFLEKIKCQLLKKSGKSVDCMKLRLFGFEKVWDSLVIECRAHNNLLVQKLKELVLHIYVYYLIKYKEYIIEINGFLDINIIDDDLGIVLCIANKSDYELHKRIKELDEILGNPSSKL